MLVSGGQILAIDRVYTDKNTISGDGVQKPLGVITDVIATTELVSGTSAKLQSEIDAVSSNFGNYYTKNETSGAEQIQEAFDNFKTTQTIVSAGSDKVSVSAIPSGDKTIIYAIDVTPGAVSIAGASGISAKQVGDTWILGLSANFLSANALDVLSAYYKKSETSAATAIDAALAATSSWANDTFQEKGNYLSANALDVLSAYYKKSETSGKDAIQSALDLKQNKADMSAYQLSGDYVSATTFAEYKTKVEQDFVNTSAWAISSFQLSGNYVSADTFTAYQQKVEQDFVNTSAWANSAFQTKGNYVSADDFNAYKEEVEQAFADTSSWAKDTFQEKGNYISADDFNTYKEEVEQTFVDTSAWANDTFQTKGDYLSANALNDVSGKWEAAYNTVNANSAYWNEVSAFSANSGMFLTPEGVTDPGLAYFLKKDEETSKIAWSGVDLSNLGKMYGISSLSDNLYAGISADPETNEPFYVVSAASAETVALPDISGSGVSAWKDDEQNKYFVSANIVGNRGVSAGYDTDTNTWNVGISANDYAYYSNTYENNAGESVDTDTIIKFVGGIARGISVDADGYITLPDNGNKFTVCVNETVSDNIDSNAHAYLSNRIQLCSIRSDSAETVLVSTNNYYATEVGASDATIAYTLTNSPNTKYFIKYAGSKIDVSKNANAKLHIVISILEEVLSLSNTEGGGERYTGIEPIYVEDVSNKIGLAFDREQFQIVPGKDPDHPSLSALQINIQTTGGNIDQEAFEKLAKIIDGRMTETIPFGALNNEASLAGAHQYAYIFRPPMEYEMTSATQAYMFGGNGDGYISVAVYEGKSSNSNLIWQSNYTHLPGSDGGEVVMNYLNNAPTGTITPNSLYYVAVRIHKSDGGAGSWSYVLGTLMHERTTSVGQLVPWCGVGGISTLNFPSTYTFSGDSMSEFGSHKPYVGFRTNN